MGEVDVIRIAAVGDLIGIQRGGGYPFSSVEAYFRCADIVFGNYEGVITSDSNAVREKAFVINVEASAVENVRRAGFSVLNVANNHIQDCGGCAARDTMEKLRRAGILTTGAGESCEEAWKEVTMDVRGRPITFIAAAEAADESGDGFNVARLDNGRIIERIADCARGDNFVIVSLHWGTENVFYPSPKQQRVARALVDAGAAVVLGHHPHRVQGIERYRNGLIVYSLGNFNFMSCGIGLNPHENTSMICEIIVPRHGAPDYRVVPVVIDEEYRPQPVENTYQGDAILKHVEDISRPLASGISEDWWLAEIARPYLAGNLHAFGIRIRRYGYRHAIACVRWLLCRYNRRVYAAAVRRRLGRCPGGAAR